MSTKPIIGYDPDTNEFICQKYVGVDFVGYDFEYQDAGGTWILECSTSDGDTNKNKCKDKGNGQVPKEPWRSRWKLTGGPSDWSDPITWL